MLALLRTSNASAVASGSLGSLTPSFLLLEVVLIQDSHAVCAFASIAQRVESVAIAQDHPPHFTARGEGETRACAREPVAGLFESRQVINMGAGDTQAKLPSMIGGQGSDVAGAEVDESLRGNFLIVIAGKRQRELGGQRQDSAQSPRAETIRVLRSARRQAERELVSGVGSTRIPEGSGRAGICRARRNPHQDADGFSAAPIQSPCGKNGAKADTSAMRKKTLCVSRRGRKQPVQTYETQSQP